MDFRHTLRLLADSLAQLDWHPPDIESHLSRRLPRQLRRLAAPMTAALLAEFPGRAAPDPSRLVAVLSGSPDAARIRDLVRRTGVRPTPPLTPPRFLPIPALDGLGLPQITTTDALADWLGLSPDELTRFADLRGLSAMTDNHFAPHYLHHLHPKSNGTLRLIEEPRPFLKRLQRQLLTRLLNLVPPHDAA
ncbi:MAG: hypothetical protein WBN04_08930, partial [Paracoccaceae bacterium]